ncbi:TetR/AcrR family transcriptional regulator [Amycolatopsis magusensis]|uniref:TetR/AcrR family transcriptional regulator n=1 Tax=Amycolatopsis magusensis TaxID=882444 RepID=UPI00378FD577
MGVKPDDGWEMPKDQARPSNLELMWGSPKRTARGPRPGLTLDEIVRAGVRVADAEGLDALSMQRVAGELGYTTMSLYRYVSGKDQLVALMSDSALGPPPEPGDGDWREEIEAWVRAMWVGYREHPWLLSVKIEGPPAGPQGLAWLEAALRALEGSGLDTGERISATMFLNAATFSLARLSIDLKPMEDFATALTLGARTGRYPILAGMLADGTFESVGAPQTEFAQEILPDLEFGLRRVLEGIEQYVSARKTAPTG